jgi:glycine/D-amino acid oxidase-like deaminating enzyme
MQSDSFSSKKNSFDIIIVGGGVYGISIAYYLSKKPHIKTLLIEQYQIGHELGSSHSPTRITRSTYEKEVYRDLNLQALSGNWKEMESVLNHKFVYDAPYIYFDNQQDTFEECKKVTVGKDNFAFMTGEQVCQKYKAMPLIKSNFPAIVDLKAGMLAADDYIQKLREYLVLKCSSNLTVL